MFVKRASSLSQTGLRITVRAPRASARRANARSLPRGIEEADVADPRIHDEAIRQKPADGRYARRSARIVPVGNARFAVGRAATHRKRNPSAAGERRPRRTIAAAASPARRKGAAQRSGSRGSSSGIDHADSSEERRRGNAIRPRSRKKIAEEFRSRSRDGSGASGFSNSKIPVPDGVWVAAVKPVINQLLTGVVKESERKARAGGG